MSGQAKKGFSAFLRQSPPEPTPGPVPEPVNLQPALPEQPAERIRHITSTGRIRTHTANRMLPGVTLRLTEERWERLKMLSIQERRPIQDILGEALDGYMKGRGLPW